MSFIFGGGGGGQTTTGTQTVTQREAPEIEARKLSLYDQASKLASSPVNLPAIQVAPISGIEQAAIRQAGQTGVGASTVQSGIGALQQGIQAPNISQFFNPFQNYVTAEIGRQGQIAQNQLGANAVAAGAFGGGRQGVAQAELQKRTLEAMGQAQGQGFQTALQAAQNQRQQQLAAGVSLGQLGQQQQAMNLADIQAQLQAGMQAPNISQFFNPFQSFVTDEITRQANIATNRLGAQAVGAGAFGGARQGIAEAEIERARLANIGQAQAQGFQTALGAAQTQRQQQLAGGQALGQLGAQQQAMSLADINAQLQAGAVQRGIGQAQLDAQRQTALQRSYEPFQRIEFLKGIMTNLPTTQSTITASTAPGANPLGQALGAGLGAYSTYNLMQPR